jgi:hypothetical protein
MLGFIAVDIENAAISELFAFEIFWRHINL